MSTLGNEMIVIVPLNSPAYRSNSKHFCLNLVAGRIDRGDTALMPAASLLPAWWQRKTRYSG